MSDSLVMVVDDSNDELALARIAARQLGINLRTASSGEEIIQYLRGEGAYGDRTAHPLPGLILLDLKMPRVSGFDVLSAARKLGLGMTVPIVVLSSSALPADREKAAEMGCFAYHTKPADFADLCRLLQRLCQFFRVRHNAPAP